MNICFVTSEYVSPLRGGVERVTYILSEVFRKYGHNVYIVSKNRPLTKEDEIDNHIVFPSIKDEENICFLEGLVINQQIDILINQSHHTVIFKICVSVKEKTKCKLISTFHTAPNYIFCDIKDKWGEICFDRFSLSRIKRQCSWILLYPYRYCMRKKYLQKRLANYYHGSDAVVLLSEQFKSDYVQIAGLDNSDKLYAIANPICQKQHLDLYDVDKKKQILFIGRMLFQAKRPDRMIRIWERICYSFPDWELYMLGDGPIKEILMEYCSERKIKNVHFTGMVNPESYYKSASILCVTSSYEGFSLVLAEALSYSVIPIAFDSFKSVRDIIKNNINGFLIEPFNIKEYARKLSTLMGNRQLRYELMRKSKIGKINNFEVDRIYECWHLLFQQI